MNVHGGPHAQYGYPFLDEFQVQAGAGYGVLYTNPRGSQGYGEAFTRAVVGDWGGGDAADVQAGLDEALGRYDWIDPARLGLLGGSYGGFMTSWIVGHSTRFKAACSERAVNSHVTMFGSSDIGHLFNVGELGGVLPWENMAKYLERSPLTYARDITTPLLIIHSEDDLRCPIGEGEQLFVALKTLRREVVFVRFPDENHELSRSGKPRHRLERFRIILDWFAKYVYAEGGHDLGAEALHRVHDALVAQVAEAHLAEDVLHPGGAQLRHLLGDPAGGAVERAGGQRLAHRLVLRHARIVERVHHRGIHAVVLGIVRGARAQHVPARVREGVGQPVLGLGVALGHVDVAPHRDVAAEPVADRRRVPAREQPVFVELEPLAQHAERPAARSGWARPAGRTRRTSPASRRCARSAGAGAGTPAGVARAGSPGRTCPGS